MFKQLKGYFKLENILLFLVAFELLGRHHYVLFILFAWVFIKGYVKRSFLNKDFLWVLLWGMSYQVFGTQTFSVVHIPALICATIIGYAMATDKESIFKMMLIIGVGYGLEGILVLVTGVETTFAVDNASREVTSIWGGGRALTAQDTMLYIFSGLIVYILANKEIRLPWKIVALFFDLFFFYDSLRTASRSPIVYCLIIIIVSLIALNSKGLKHRTLFSVIFLFFVLFILYESNFLGIRSITEDSYLFTRIMEGDDGGVRENTRFRLHSHFLDRWNQNMWGGLHEEIGYYFHNTWMDMFAFSGILGFITFIGVTIRFLVNFLYVFKRSDNEERSVWAGIFMAYLLPFMFEPIYWGAPAYFAFFFVFYGMLSKRRSVLAQTITVSRLTPRQYVTQTF